MAIAYEGIAAHIALTSTGATAVSVEMDIPAGSLLLITNPGGHGQSAVPAVNYSWGSNGNYYIIADVTDDAGNAWGYAMDTVFDGFMGNMPLSYVFTPLAEGDNIYIDLEISPGDTSLSSPAYVGRVLCFSGLEPYYPANGMPIAMVTPWFNTPYLYPSGFFTLDPDDAIPLPRLINPGNSTFGQKGAFQEADNPSAAYGMTVVKPTSLSYGVPTESLWVSAISWDGTGNPWDYYYTDNNNSTFPTPSTAPGAYGLSADNGTFDFTQPDPGDGTWVDLGFDTMATTLESRYAYMIEPSPTPNEWEGPVIHVTYDVADGSWGTSYAQQADADSTPYEPGSYINPPGWPTNLLGDPNIIGSPVNPTLTFIEGIATGAVRTQRFDVKIT